MRWRRRESSSLVKEEEIEGLGVGLAEEMEQEEKQEEVDGVRAAEGGLKRYFGGVDVVE